MIPSKKIEDEAPKRPATAYFKFRSDIWPEIKEEKDPNKIVKTRWDNLDQEAKDKYKSTYEAGMKEYKVKKEAWDEKNGKQASKKERKSVEKKPPKVEA